MSGGMMFASMTAWICSLLPAVMLEMVQQASLRMPFFDELSRLSSHGSALKLMITCKGEKMQTQTQASKTQEREQCRESTKRGEVR